MARVVIAILVGAAIGTFLGNRIFLGLYGQDENFLFKYTVGMSGYVVSQDDPSHTLIVRVRSTFPSEATSTRDFSFTYDANTNWLASLYRFTDGVNVRREVASSTQDILPVGTLVFVQGSYGPDSTQSHLDDIVILHRLDL